MKYLLWDVQMGNGGFYIRLETSLHGRGCFQRLSAEMFLPTSLTKAGGDFSSPPPGSVTVRTKVRGDTCAQVATSWEGMYGQQTSGGLEPKGHSWWPGRCSAFPPLLIKAELALLDVCTPKMVLFAWKAKRTFEQRGRSIKKRSCMGLWRRSWIPGSSSPEGLMMGLISHPELLIGDSCYKNAVLEVMGSGGMLGKGPRALGRFSA